MASKYIRSAPAKMTANYATPDADIIDMGAFRVVGVHRRALSAQAGTAAVVTVQHNASKDPDGWIPTTVTFRLDGTLAEYAEVTSFLRYLRIFDATGAGNGAAVFQFDWLGKE